jgi:hypothetical protein
MHLSNFRPVKRVPDCVEIFALVRAKMPAKLDAFWSISISALKLDRNLGQTVLAANSRPSPKSCRHTRASSRDATTTRIPCVLGLSNEVSF